MAWEEVDTDLQGAVFPLPSGGNVTITDKKQVSMGDGFTFRLLTYTNGGCEIVFEVRDGVPGAVSIKLSGDGFIRQKDLTAIRLDQIRGEVYAVAGVGAYIPEGGSNYGETDYQLSAAKARKALKKAGSRRTITPGFLAKVAEIHNNAPEGTRTNAVVAAFKVDQRTAFRYIARAKQEGLIRGND